MAYVPLALPKSLPNPVLTAIRIGVDPLLEDVHWMLATTISMPNDTGPRRQFQTPIAHVLLATVAGVSTELFHPPDDKKNTGDRFRECLSRYFPWHIDPPENVTSECAARILYGAFRNPLVHYLGWSKPRRPTVRLGQVFRGTDDAENSVEELERLTEKPYSKPFLVVTPQSRTLQLDSFYWCIRKLVECWSSDGTQVSHAAKRLVLRC